MSIQIDWEIVDQELPDEETPLPPVTARPRRPRGLWLVLGGLALLVVVASTVAAYWAWWTYRMRLNQVAEPVRQVAQLEAQVIATNDRVSFMALQDPDDRPWRAMQEKRFARLERVGLPELGWTAMDTPPSYGKVELEPGGARVDVTYHFSVTQPMPGGPVSVTLRVPQFYKPTPSGWVRAMPGPDLWGPLRPQSGKHFALWCQQRDASLLGPLIPRMDKLLEGVCNRLDCPAQPILVIFENSPEAMTRLTDLAMGFDDHAFTLRLPSPQLFGVPADARSRDELYRMVGTRVIQALMYEATGRRLNMDYLSSQEIMRWELAQAGLTGPFITPAIKRALVASARANTWRPLSTLSLRSRPVRLEADPNEALTPMALAFVAKQMGANAISRLIPHMGTSQTFGEAINKSFDVNPATLEPAWQKYLREQAGLAPTVRPAQSPPDGELALECRTGNRRLSIWRVGTDGTGLTQVTSNTQDFQMMAWSPDGKKLAYTASDHVAVKDADSQQVISIPVQGMVGWLPSPQGAGPARLTVVDLGNEGPADKKDTHLVNLDTGEDFAITGRSHTWSPDGTQVAYSTGPDSTIWVADADGRNARQAARGDWPAWSPDSKRLAFFGAARPVQIGAYTRSVATAIQVLDVASGAVKTLARMDELLSPGEANYIRIEWTNGLTWSPNGSMLAVMIRQQSNTMLVILDANTGAVEPLARMDELLSPGKNNHLSGGIGGLAWSPDSSMLVVEILQQSDPTLVILDAVTGAVRARQRGELFSFARYPARTWSPDSRYVVFGVGSVPLRLESGSGELGILDAQTGQSMLLPSIGFWDWSSDGKWLAAAQFGYGALLATPDLSSVFWPVEGMDCFSVAWRPGH